MKTNATMFLFNSWKTRKPTLFELHREYDKSGISGIGHVLDGIVFPDGTCVVRWRSKTPSTAVFDSYKKFEKTHVRFHGKFKIIWTGDSLYAKGSHEETGGTGETSMARAFANAKPLKVTPKRNELLAEMERSTL